VHIRWIFRQDYWDPAQRFVLAQLAESLGLAVPITDLAWDWMHYKDACGCTDFSQCSCEPNANELESIRRAVRSLEREGLVHAYWEVYWEDGETISCKTVELTAKGIRREVLP
jgi:hypothetical protein